MLKPSHILALGVAVAAVAACERPDKATRDLDGRAPPLRQISALQCPEHQGPLTRVRVAPDGLSCDYAGPRGAEVTLRLVKADAEGADAALSPIENELRALMPDALRRIAEGAPAASAEDAARAADQAAADASAEASVDARADASADASAATGESVDIDLPGVSIQSEGENAKIRMPGIHVDATDGGAQVRVGPLRIDADETEGDANVTVGDQRVVVKAKNDAAEIRTEHDTDEVRRTYILADERRTDGGWELVGYEARGPKSGPVVVAVVRSKHRRDDNVFDSAKDLVERNVGR
jgi:hypothetical protein